MNGRLARQILLLIAAIGCSMATSSLWGDEPTGAKKIVMTVTSAVDTDKSDTLEKLLKESMHVALEVAGFQWIASDNTVSASPIQLRSGAASAWSDLYDYGAKESADLILAAFYQQDGDDVTIEFQLHDLAQRKLTVSGETEGRLDLTFDRLVTDAIEKMVTRSGVSPTRPYTAENASAEDQEQPGVAASTAEKNGADVSPSDGSPPEASPIENDTAPVATRPAVDVGEPGVVPTNEPQKTVKIQRLELSAGFAPFLTVGGASEYFRFGLLPSLYVNYRIPVGSGYLAFGIFSGANYFQASGIIATSDSLLIPAGVDFRLAPIGGTRLNLFLRLSGGPALLILNPNKTGALSKVVPYALGGIGLNIALGRWFGFTLDSSFSIFYEQSLPIMGYTPSVYLFIRI